MMTRRWATWMVGLDLCLLLVGLGATAVVAEPYLQLQGGIGFPSRLSSFEGEYHSKGKMSVSDLALQPGAAYGAKAGYWFRARPYLGAEVDYLHTSPGDRGQDYWITDHRRWRPVTKGAHEPDIQIHVDALALNLALRYPGERWHPYVAAGPALLWGNYGGDPTNTTLGLNAEAGVRVTVWNGLFVSASYKYQQARFTFRESTGPHGSINGFNALYENQFVLAGLGWAF
jgi:opacity protein-like surface antigen